MSHHLKFAHLATRMFETPLALHPGKAQVVIAALGERLGVASTVKMLGGVGAFDGDEFDRPGETFREEGYDCVLGVAKIEIEGILVNKLGTLRPYSGMTGYDGIRQSIGDALADPEVRAIMLDIDSPGGEVSGCFDLVDDLYKARGKKPIWAILTDSAYSAAYAIASAADKIIVPETGGTGSIGCIWMHYDYSKALAAAGIKVTVVKWGDRKADGAEEFPLSEEAFSRAQRDIDTMGGIFANRVARNRGLIESAIREMQAATFLGVEGVSLGLADEVMAPDAAFRALLEQIS
jgi:signal peptide peptidase SppA